jgi:tetratricopeptide (TPR) repeat protein
MEILKNKLILTVLIVFCFSFRIYSQTQEQIQTAFKNSYTYEKNKEYAKAIAEILNVYDEKSYVDNIRLGWLFYTYKSYLQSSGYYAKAFKLMPYSVEALLGYSKAQYQFGNWDNAITGFSSVLKIDSKNVSSNYWLGVIYYKKADYKNAYYYLETIANMYPFDYDTTLLFAWTHFQLGQLAQAKILFNKVLLIKPGDASALEGLSLIK